MAWGWGGQERERERERGFPCLKTIIVRSQSEDDSFSCSKSGLEKGKGKKRSLNYIASYDRFKEQLLITF